MLCWYRRIFFPDLSFFFWTFSILGCLRIFEKIFFWFFSGFGSFRVLGISVPRGIFFWWPDMSDRPSALSKILASPKLGGPKKKTVDPNCHTGIEAMVEKIFDFIRNTKKNAKIMR